MVPYWMATFPVRSNIAIFLISMSLMLTLALGIYASNRLLTYWLLVRGLEHSFLPQEQAVAEILAATNERPATPASVAGLRLSSPDDAVHDLAAIKALKRLFQDESTGTIALDAALLLPAAPNAGAPSSANSLPASWTGEKRFLSTDTLNRTRAVLGSTGLAVVPEVTWHGKIWPQCRHCIPAGRRRPGDAATAAAGGSVDASVGTGPFDLDNQRGSRRLVPGVLRNRGDHTLVGVLR
ncbi:hypothetical protein QW131_15085 [Roseibium salinum]|nr:hypothetical protein [Roseibium salinum]